MTEPTSVASKLSLSFRSTFCQPSILMGTNGSFVEVMERQRGF